MVKILIFRQNLNIWMFGLNLNLWRKFGCLVKIYKLRFKDTHPLRCCRFNSTDGSYIVGSNTKKLRRFDRPDKNETEPKILDEIIDLHDASIYCCDIGPRRRFLGGWRKILRKKIQKFLRHIGVFCCLGM